MFTIQNASTGMCWDCSLAEAVFWATIGDGFAYNIYRIGGNGTPLNLFEIY